MKTSVRFTKSLLLLSTGILLLAACNLPGGAGVQTTATATAPAATSTTCDPAKADCGSPIAGAGASLTDTPAGPTLTPTALPVTIDANVVYDHVHYGACEPSTLKVKASVHGDLSTLDTVRVSYVYDTPTSSGPFGLGDVPFDPNIMTRQPDGTYLWSTNLNTDAARWGIAGGSYMLYVYVEAFSHEFGGVGGPVGPISVHWDPCPAAAPPTPTFTSAPVVLPSVTITRIDPADTGYYYTGCGPNSITISVHATIAPGPSTVSLDYRYSSGVTGSLTMGALGSGNYQAVLPLDLNTYNALHGANGSVSFTVRVADSHGHTASTSGGPVAVLFCPG
ncbi:MAG TPA: hypothetical protein VMC09_12815 [Anaerolineales bacterium]|nr:hypothetical protein [Anaerolineales bacterium]